MKKRLLTGAVLAFALVATPVLAQTPREPAPQSQAKPEVGAPSKAQTKDSKTHANAKSHAKSKCRLNGKRCPESKARASKARGAENRGSKTHGSKAPTSRNPAPNAPENR
ncbi:hypothetical protein SAMN02745157_3982 [Kaistia soli DSM 19436]|uniref:Uncharacterized protein n=1 Tax=Kaistia soli DSM 19436 TaxID=1122133 RepID=A0A1M5IS42_9HYPH|nr:hypothetical protein SAMN02745157_3982 [Kaistia soli DSM 19436]